MDPWMTIGGAVAGGAGGIIGGIMDSQAEDRRLQKAHDFEGGQADRNIALQREFAQNGIRWKVEDAKAAGIHPLYALGANTHSFSPVSVGSGPIGRSSVGGSIARGLGGMGQDISRALAATQTEDERRIAKANVTLAEANAKNAQLENEVKQIQLNKLNNVGPALPSAYDGSKFLNGSQGDANSLVKLKPVQRNMSEKGTPYSEAGDQPGVTWERTPHGLSPVIPQAMSESFENDFLGGASWQWRNRVLPLTGDRSGAPASKRLPPGYEWEFHGLDWRPKKGKARSGASWFNEFSAGGR